MDQWTEHGMNMDEWTTYGIQFHRGDGYCWIRADVTYVTIEQAMGAWEDELKAGRARIIKTFTTESIVAWTRYGTH